MRLPSERDVQDRLDRPLTEQEAEAIVRPLLSRGIPVEGVLEALRAAERPEPQPADDELRTIRYEALADGTVRRID